jgi:hypothetical protein
MPTIRRAAQEFFPNSAPHAPRAAFAEGGEKNLPGGKGFSRRSQRFVDLDCPKTASPRGIRFWSPRRCARRSVRYTARDDSLVRLSGGSALKQPQEPIMHR